MPPVPQVYEFADPLVIDASQGPSLLEQVDHIFGRIHLYLSVRQSKEWNDASRMEQAVALSRLQQELRQWVAAYHDALQNSLLTLFEEDRTTFSAFVEMAYEACGDDPDSFQKLIPFFRWDAETAATILPVVARFQAKERNKSWYVGSDHRLYCEGRDFFADPELVGRTSALYLENLEHQTGRRYLAVLPSYLGRGEDGLYRVQWTAVSETGETSQQISSYSRDELIQAAAIWKTAPSAKLWERVAIGAIVLPATLVGGAHLAGAYGAATGLATTPSLVAGSLKSAAIYGLIAFDTQILAHLIRNPENGPPMGRILFSTAFWATVGRFHHFIPGLPWLERTWRGLFAGEETLVNVLPKILLLGGVEGGTFTALEAGTYNATVGVATDEINSPGEWADDTLHHAGAGFLGGMILVPGIRGAFHFLPRLVAPRLVTPDGQVLDDTTVPAAEGELPENAVAMSQVPPGGNKGGPRQGPPRGTSPPRTTSPGERREGTLSKLNPFEALRRQREAKARKEWERTNPVKLGRVQVRVPVDKLEALFEAVDIETGLKEPSLGIGYLKSHAEKVLEAVQGMENVLVAIATQADEMFILVAGRVRIPIPKSQIVKAKFYIALENAGKEVSKLKPEGQAPPADENGDAVALDTGGEFKGGIVEDMGGRWVEGPAPPPIPRAAPEAVVREVPPPPRPRPPEPADPIPQEEIIESEVVGPEEVVVPDPVQQPVAPPPSPPSGRTRVAMAVDPPPRADAEAPRVCDASLTPEDLEAGLTSTGVTKDTAVVRIEELADGKVRLVLSSANQVEFRRSVLSVFQRYTQGRPENMYRQFATQFSHAMSEVSRWTGLRSVSHGPFGVDVTESNGTKTYSFTMTFQWPKTAAEKWSRLVATLSDFLRGSETGAEPAPPPTKRKKGPSYL